MGWGGFTDDSRGWGGEGVDFVIKEVSDLGDTWENR